MIVDVLMNYQDEFKALYKDMLLDISISQWRNIADHGSYENVENGVEVTYGANDEFKKVISVSGPRIAYVHIGYIIIYA